MARKLAYWISTALVAVALLGYFDPVFGEEIDRVFKEKCDLLLGRKTYEIFAGYCPYYGESASAGGIAKLFKEIKKYVAKRQTAAEKPSPRQRFSLVQAP